MNKSYTGCLRCGKELSKNELIVRERMINDSARYIRGYCCDSCYERFKEPTIEEVLEKLRGYKK